jgi:flagellar biosynthesis protein FlhB
MSEEDQSSKTEQPTERRIEKAFEEGNVTQSKEISHFLILMAVALIFLYYIPMIAKDFLNILKNFLELTTRMPYQNISGHVFHHIAFDTLKILALPFVLLFIAALGSHFLQHKFVISSKALEFDLTKLSPFEGLKRLFSLKAFVDFIQNLIKITIVSVVVITLLRQNISFFEHVLFMEPIAILKQSSAMLLKIMIGVLSVLFLIAAADYLFQYFERLRKLKMSREEIKEEMKESQGDPHVKGKRMQLRFRNRKRMMAAVKTATFVVTNPTHFAVALLYDENGMGAPKVVAKGTDFIALKIREIALENNIPILSNPPLARMLHKEVEIDSEISPTHYKAVAEVVRYVWSLKKK